MHNTDDMALEIATPFQDSYFSYLQKRFANQKLNEILFIERPGISGPRFSLSDLKRISLSVREILRAEPSLQNRMHKTFEFPAFRLDSSATFIPEENIDFYSNLYSRVHLLRSKYSGEFDDDRIKRAFSIWLKDRNSTDKTRELLDFLILSSISPTALSRYTSVSSSVLLLHWNYVLKSAYESGTRLKLPQRLLESLLQLSSFPDFDPKPLLRGLIAIPMTLEEAIFKGVGPGECVRTSVFRYIDSFFEDTKVLKILKDGVEVGYFTIYETVNKRGQNIWLIETIQGPIVRLAKNKTSVVDHLIASLQTLSAQSNALIAVPGQSMNTYNFKEISSTLISSREYAAGFNTLVDYKNNSSIEPLNQIALQGHSSLDQLIIQTAGYKKSSIVNAMSLNNGNVRVLAPSYNLESNFLEVYVRLFSNFLGRPVNLPSESLHPVLRKAYLHSASNDFSSKKLVFDIFKRFESEGDFSHAEIVQSLVYKQLPKQLWDKSFHKKLLYVENRIKTVILSDKVATELKAEILLSAESWDEFISVIRLGDKGSSFSTLLLQALTHFAKLNNHSNWVEVYMDFLKLTQNPSQDFLLSLIISDKIKSADEFLKFSQIAAGKSGSMRWDDIMARSAFLAQESRRFTDFAIADEKFIFFDNLLALLNEGADLQVRTDLAETFLTIEELQKLRLIGHGKYSNFSKFGRKVYKGIILETFRRITKNMSIHEILKREILFPEILKDFDRVAITEFIRILAPKFQSTNEIYTVIKTLRLNHEVLSLPSFLSDLDPKLIVEIILNDISVSLKFFSKLRIGTIDAIFAAETAELPDNKNNFSLLGKLKILWKTRSSRIIHPDDAIHLSKVLTALERQPDLLAEFILKSSLFNKSFQLNLELVEHKNLLFIANSIARNLKPEVTSRLNKVFENRLFQNDISINQNTELTAYSIGGKLKSKCHSSLKLRE
ncbi:MAG: hypothetical protein ACK5V3_03590 [Bdellovibrionales bacterium]